MSELPRYMNCLICKHYHTTYPYCDMCKDENRFEYASISMENERFNSVITDDYDLPKKLNISTNCLICGEPIPMEHMGDYPKICEKCKEAVKYARTLMESDLDIFIEKYLSKG